jgi:hypothetical protein
LLYGEEKEKVFVERLCPALGLRGEINPEKSINPYAPDLVVDGVIADLKCQETPFFKAKELYGSYGLEPQTTVTFNKKDYERYAENYPQLMIYFWVYWKETKKCIRDSIYSVAPMFGVWRTPFAHIQQIILSGNAPLHNYQRRVYDIAGNAKESYLLSLDQFDQLLQLFR